MQTYIMFGKYTTEALKGISGKRGERCLGLIQQFGGTVSAMYATLGKHDLVLIVQFPSVQKLIKTSVELNKLTGISFSSEPAITVDEFDKVVAEE